MQEISLKRYFRNFKKRTLNAPDPATSMWSVVVLQKNKKVKRG